MTQSPPDRPRAGRRARPFHIHKCACGHVDVAHAKSVGRCIAWECRCRAFVLDATQADK